MTPRFRAIIFDVGDILYDATPWRRWLTTELQRWDPAMTFDRLVAEWESLLTDVYRGRADYWQGFGELLGRLGVPPEARARLERDARSKGDEVKIDRQPFPGVPETLAKLQAAGVRVVALSDSERPAYGVRETLNQLGIEHFFDAVVSSHDLGSVKPEPAAYTAALVAVGATVEESAFVGHDEDELAGARSAGLFVIAFNSRDGVTADARLVVFSDLIGVGVVESA